MHGQQNIKQGEGGVNEIKHNDICKTGIVFSKSVVCMCRIVLPSCLHNSMATHGIHITDFIIFLMFGMRKCTS